MDEDGRDQAAYEDSIAIGSTMIHPDLGKWMLDSSTEWAELSLRLHGWHVDPESPQGNWKRGESLMNPYGIRLIIDTLIAGISHKGVYLSNLNQNETYSIARQILHDVSKMLFCYYNEFGIKNMADQTTIMELIRANIMAVLKRPFNQGERDFFKKFTKETRVVSQEQKKGFGLFGRGS